MRYFVVTAVYIVGEMYGNIDSVGEYLLLPWCQSDVDSFIMAPRLL